MVAVRMVSEGVDVPRLAVGRLRHHAPRRRCSSPRPSAASCGPAARGETASVFLPSVPTLLGFAAEMEVERDHVLGRRVTDEDDIFAAEDDLLAQAQRQRGGLATSWLAFEALGSQARFDRVLFDGGEFGHDGRGARRARRRRWTSSASPACSSPTRCASCCSAGSASVATRTAVGRGRGATPSRSSPPTSSSPSCAASSTAWSPPGTTAPARPHGVTHAALRKECGGPAAAIATADQLHARIDRLREWAARKTG